MDDFLQKLKKVVRIVLYGPAISQSDCRKAGPYQLPYDNVLHCTSSCNRHLNSFKMYRIFTELWATEFQYR